MKIVASADNHMWPLIWKRFPQIRGDSEFAVRDLFDYARNNDLPVILAGDLFDHGESGEVSRELLLFDRYRHDHPTYFVIGNHEDSGWFAAGEPNDAWLSVLVAQDRGLHHLHPWTNIGELTVGGIDYHRGPDFGPALESYRQNLADNNIALDIFVCHQAIRELLSFEGAYQTTCEQLAGIAPIVIIGDVHIPRIWEVEGTIFVSPGSTTVNSWDELAFENGRSTNRRGFFVLDIEKTGGTAKLAGYERVEIPNQRTFFDLSAATAEEETAVLETLQSYLDDSASDPLDMALARVRYNADSRSFRNELETLVGPKLALDPVPVVQALEAPKELQALAPEEGEVAVKTVVERHVDPQVDPRLADVLVEILEDPAGRPDKILDRVVAEIVAGVEEGEAGEV